MVLTPLITFKKLPEPGVLCESSITTELGQTCGDAATLIAIRKDVCNTAGKLGAIALLLTV